MEFTVLEILWFFVEFFLIAGYFILDGFDLGIGVLSPFVSRNDYDYRVLRRAIGPIWDGNEVWLIVAGGALFAAFPDVYATTFSGFYLAVMLVLFGLIVRAVSFEFGETDYHWRKLWDGCFFIGSLLPALLLGVAAGNAIQGIPMDAHGNYTGFPLFGLITPFTILTGVLGLSMMLSAGACWAAQKAPKPSALQHRMARIRRPLFIASIILFIGTTIYALFLVVPNVDGTLQDISWVFGGITLGALIVGFVTGGKNSKEDLVPFLSQSVASGSLVFTWAFTTFPHMVIASATSIGDSIGIGNAASSEVSLISMTVILCIGLPLVLLYHVLIYRTYRGRVDLHEEGAY